MPLPTPTPIPDTVTSTSGSTDPVPLPAAFSAALAQAQADAAPPVPFEPNVGQVDGAVRYLAHGPGYTLFLTNSDAELVALQAQPPATDTLPATGTIPLSTSPLHRRHRTVLGPLSGRVLDSVTQTSPPTQTTGQVLRLGYVGGNTAPQIVAQNQLTGTVNYFIGNDPSAWHTDIPTYGAVVYRDVYPGIDLNYQSQAGSLEYVWQVSPGADPGAILLQVGGAQGLSIDGQGNLVMATAVGPMEQQVPHAYQVVNGQQVTVSVQYTLQGPNQVGFTLGSYDPSVPLTIDPVLSYSTYLGGNSFDEGNSVAVDTAGNAYVTGLTESTNFITTTGAFSISLPSMDGDVFVTKLSSSGNVALYSTYLGGTTGDSGQAIAVDSAGNIYVTGFTTSDDFPTTTNAYSRTLGGPPDTTYDGFVTKLNPNLNGAASLIYSTYLGGGNIGGGQGIAVDRAGNVYVTGYTDSSDFPTTTNAYSRTFSGRSDAFVSELSTAISGTAGLLYSTFLGGSDDDSGRGIALDAAGNAYVTGTNNSSDFPTTTNAYSRTFSGRSDAFVSELSTAISGTAGLLYSTFLGGSGDAYVYGIAVDAAGKAYVTGYTGSSDFPTTTNAYSRTLSGSLDAFVSELSTAISGTAGLLYSTFLGGSDDDFGYGIAVDAAGNAYVTGETYSTNFPTVNPVQSHCGDSSCTSADSSAFVTKFGATTSGDVPWHSDYTVRLSDHIQASVDLVDGHLDLHLADMHLGAKMLDLNVGHTWDSTLAQAGITSTAGQGWVSSLTPSMGGTLTSTVVFTDASGAVWPFVYTGALTTTAPFTSYFTPPGQPWALTTSSAGYTLTDILTNEALTFDSSGRLLADTDEYANNNTLTYTSTAAMPITETNSGGRWLRFYYNGNGLLSAEQSPLNRTGGVTKGQFVAYGYTGGTQLSAVTWGYQSPTSVTAQFAYSGTQLVTVTTPGGHQWVFSYDAQGRVAGLASLASGDTPKYTTLFLYHAGNTTLVEGYKRPEQRVTGYVYDGQGQTFEMIDGFGHYSYAFYDTDHDPTVTVDRNFHATYYAYQYVGPSLGTGILTQTVQQALAPTNAITNSYFYDTGNRLVKSISGNGGLTYYQYDGAHHSVITTTQQLGPSGPWRGDVRGFNTAGEQTTYIDGRGVLVPTSAPGVTPTASLSPTSALATWTWTYSITGDLSSASTPPITTTLGGQQLANMSATTVYTSDADGNLTSQSSPNGATTVFQYDTLGQLTQTTYPSITLYTGLAGMPSTTVGYDGDGNVITTTDGAGDPTTASYDPLGRAVAITNPVNATTLYTYSAISLLDRQDPAGHVVRYGYDQIGRPITVTDPLSTTSQLFNYDNVGNTIAITTPLDYANPAALTVETRGYDPLNQPITDTVASAGVTPAPPAQTTAWGYDNDGNLMQQTLPTGDQTQNSFDLGDRRTQISVLTNPPALQTLSLDPADNLTQQVDFTLRTHTFTLNGANRLVQQVETCPYCGTYSSPITTTPSYDPDGNVLTQTVQTVRPGILSLYRSLQTYNGLDWLASQDDGWGATSYGYDAAGRLRSETLPGASVTITHAVDAAGRVTSTGDSLGTSVFSYTLTDRPLTDTMPGGVSQTRQYDGDDRLTQVQFVGSNYGTQTYGYVYSPQGRTVTITNADFAGLIHPVWPLSYDAQGRLAGITTTDTTQQVWHYDGIGNITGWNGVLSGHPTNPQATYAYTYAVIGALTPTNWLPNELVVYTDTSGLTTTYGYDRSGDTTVINAPNGLTYQLNYDALGRLGSVARLSGASCCTWFIAYDAWGRRLAMTAIGSGTPAPPPAFQEVFQYRGHQVSQVIVTGANTTPFTETFVYRTDGSPLALLYQKQDGSGHNLAAARYSYVLDGQGSVVALTDITGTAVDHYVYDLWGTSTLGSTWVEAIPQPLRYRGYWWDGWDNALTVGWGGGQDDSADAALPWYWLGPREYDPTLERFLQPDPSAQDGVRSYVYCRDDPVNCADPSGLGEPDPQHQGSAEAARAVRANGSGLEPVPLEAVPGTGVPADPTAEEPPAASIGDQTPGVPVGSEVDNANDADIADTADTRITRDDPRYKAAMKVLVSRFKPMSARFAGKIYHPFHSWMRRAYPNGVPFSEYGFPNFSQYVYKMEDGTPAEVQIEPSEHHPTDEERANAAAGFEETPAGYTWHHVEDGITMQLVPMDLHQEVGHTGGFSTYQRLQQILQELAQDQK
jgi:RHS repeat-associated protein